ncbi:MAG: S1 RNA-binding domain-containing protein [Tessaracoccus sp.]
MTSSTEASTVAVDDFGTPEAFLAAVDATIKYFNDGDIVSGTVVKVDRDEVLLDIGYKTEGVIPSKELSIKHDVDPFDVVQVGDEIEALVQQKEDKEGRLILSKKRAQYERAWGAIEKIKEEDGVVTGSVIEVVKGGLIVDIGLRGFLPASLVEMRRVRDLQPYVGMELEAKIIELDKNRNNVVLSRRAWLEQTQSEVRQTFLTQLQKGQIRKGVVSSIVNFGAFVDLGGVDGLVHVSELAERHVEIPEQVVSVGDQVMVKVIDIDLERRRVSLSLKQANEGIDIAADEFDPSLYGMTASYDDQGNYIYPEGFDPETNEWKEGYDEQRSAWEQQYAEAQARWEAHKRQVEEAEKAGQEAVAPQAYVSEDADSGSLASDEALQALRDKLTGGR